MLGIAVLVSVLALARMPALDPAWQLPWWVMAPVFWAAEAQVIHFHFRRGAHTFSLNELPLVVGFFLANPLELVIAQAIGSAAALAINRHQPPVKLAFNIGSFALSSVVGLLVFRAVGSGGLTEPMRWFAAYTDGRIAAYCELRSRGGVAQIEDVNTLAEFRGRGLGRALVQHALGEARRGHELVFLEALEDDWPNQLYAKLGFDVVGRYHHILLPASPLTRLRLRTPRLELRLPTVSELRALAEVARAGIHDPAEMPFETAWTDNAASASFVEDFVAYHLATLRDSRPERWRLELVAFLDGEPVGVQGIGAVDFPHRREVSTGSWLGEQWQRQGLGTEMRAAVLSLAFTGLGAQTAVSAAWEHNDSSLGVSRKLGYVETGTRLSQPRAEPLVHRVLRLDRTAFRSPVPVELAGLEGLAPLFHR